MSFPFYKQPDAMDCGVCCLRMIAAYHKRYYTYKALRNHVSASIDGVSLLGISKAAECIGFQSMSGLVTSDTLATKAVLPCILHWNQNHFVVLYKTRKGKKFYVADPGKGLVTYSRKEMEAHWVSTSSDGEDKGIAMFLMPVSGFSKITEEKAEEKRSFRFLFDYLKQYGNEAGQILLGLLIGCLLQMAMPFLTQSIVDVGIRNQDIGFVWLVLTGQLTIVAGRTATDFIRRWLLLHIGMGINISLVSDFFIKLLKLPMSFFDTKLMGDLLQRMADHGRVQSFLTEQVLNVTFGALGFIVFGVVLFLYDKAIFGVFLAGSLLYGLWIALFLHRRRVLDYELFEKQAINQNKTYQFITSMQEIKLQDCEQRRRWEWEDTQADLYEVQMKSLKLKQTQEAGGLFINELKNMTTTVLAATAVIDGEMTLGMMLAVQYIIGQLNSPVEQLMAFIYSLQDVRISLERINEIHHADNEETNNGIREFASTDLSITIEHADFKYDHHALFPTIKNVSLIIPEGKVTALVGASGSGKTTLVKLMLGYYPVMAGRIVVAGRDLNEYSLKWWRKQCGAVMQEGVIFSESMARNIAVDDDAIDTARLEHAARIANIHDYIMGLPLKYNTTIGRDGVGLSQGQKQRILIARAVYKQPRYIFLDEATNALDAENERFIVENLNEFYKGRTVVVVAHRLSTVKNADQIVVIENGQVAEIGTHASLIEQKGVYYHLVKNQLELGN